MLLLAAAAIVSAINISRTVHKYALWCLIGAGDAVQHQRPGLEEEEKECHPSCEGQQNEGNYGRYEGSTFPATAVRE